ncbi:nickel ABC transporter permease subunit NikB [Camelimonas abortus]|uniref:Nickel ABC transporter permease subunit NikB n=1 Tax=Camelimonas abortus TaxID=1017184 RepID=A0ABV7LGQ4_9HYPH
MARYALRRLLLLPPVLLAVSAVIFLLLRLAPSDPAMDYLRLSRTPPTPEALAAARSLLGLDQPMLAQYGDWLWRALRLDFGSSWALQRPVLPDMLARLPATLELAGLSLLITLAVSLPLGAWAARRRDGLPDHLVRLIAFIGVSAPNFWVGFLLVAVFSAQLGWLPSMGRGDWRHAVLPALAVSLMSVAVNARLLRASLLECAGQRHVAYARLRGLPERQVERAHILRNALTPVVTSIGLHAGELFGGALVIESIFAWPGIGRYAVTAIYNRDYPVIQCFILMMATIFVICNLIADLISAWVDPRIRATMEAAR